MEVTEVAVIGAGAMGAASPRTSPMPGCRSCCSISCRRTADRNALARGAVASMLEAETGGVHARRRGTADHRWQSRGRPRRHRPTATGSSRRSSSGSTSRGSSTPGWSGPPPGSDRVVRTPRRSARQADRGPPRGFRRRLPDHPLLQPAALHAAARDRGGAGDPSGGDRGGRASSPIAGSARASSAPRTRPASSPTGSAPTGCRRRSTGDRARAARRGGRCRARRRRSACPRPACSGCSIWSAST